MKVVDFAGMSFVRGQRLRVDEEAGTFYGKFDKLALNNTRLDLVEVTDGAGKSCGRFRYFDQQYVYKVQLADMVGNKLCNSEQIDLKPKPKKIQRQLADKQLEHIMKTIKEPVIVNQPGSVYFNALADIYKQLTVGVAADGAQSGRLGRIQKLAISTNNQLYIFDLLLLSSNKVMSDLKKLFESSAYLKLVFDCRLLLDNLKSHFDIKVESSFDLMLAAAQFHPKEKVSSVKNCIETVLGVVPSSHRESHAAFFPALYQAIISSHFTKGFHRKFEQFISPSNSLESFFSKFTPSDSLNTSLNDQDIIKGLQEIDFSIYNTNQASGSTVRI